MGRKNHDERFRGVDQLAAKLRAAALEAERLAQLEVESDHLNAARRVRYLIEDDGHVETLWEVLGGHVVVVHDWTSDLDRSLEALHPSGWEYRIYASDEAGNRGDQLAVGDRYLPSETDLDDMGREVIAQLRLNPGA